MSAAAVIADSTPLYALVDSDDQYARRAHAQLQVIHAEDILVAVPIPILMETHTLILRRLGVQRAQAWIQEIVEASFTPHSNAEDVRQAVEVIRRYSDQPITLTDAVVAAMCQRLRFPVWTYDHHFDIMQVEVWRDA